MDRFKHMPGMTRAMLEIAGIGFAITGIFLIAVYGSRAYEAYTSQFWSTTFGAITRSAVGISGDAFGNRHYSRIIKYGYSVNIEGEDAYFISDRVGFGVEPASATNSQAAVEATLASYPKGVSVKVFYNPKFPDQSILEPYFSWRYLSRPSAGMLCLVGAVALVKLARFS